MGLRPPASGSPLGPGPLGPPALAAHAALRGCAPAPWGARSRPPSGSFGGPSWFWQLARRGLRGLRPALPRAAARSATARRNRCGARALWPARVLKSRPERTCSPRRPPPCRAPSGLWPLPAPGPPLAGALLYRRQAGRACFFLAGGPGVPACCGSVLARGSPLVFCPAPPARPPWFRPLAAAASVLLRWAGGRSHQGVPAWLLLRPRCLGLLRALARLRSRRSPLSAAPRRATQSVWGQVLPCAPRPPPPLGAPGARGPLGLRPALGRASRAPVAGPQRAARAARCGLSGPVNNPKIVNHPLTAARKRGILEVRGPFRSLGGRRKVSVDGTKPRLVFDQAGLLFYPPPRARSAFSHSILVRQTRLTQQNLCYFVAFSRSKRNRPRTGPSEPLRWPLAPFGGFGNLLTRNKIMVLCRLPRCIHLHRHYLTGTGPACQALFRPGFARRRRPLACNCLSAMAYSSVTSMPP